MVLGEGGLPIQSLAAALPRGLPGSSLAARASQALLRVSTQPGAAFPHAGYGFAPAIGRAMVRAPHTRSNP